MFKLLSEKAKLPTKAHETDVGYDLYALEDCNLAEGTVTKVRTGIAYGGFDPLSEASTTSAMAIFPKIEGRSGLAAKGIHPVGGIVDPGYRGELVVMLRNTRSDLDYFIKAGDRIAQMVFYMTAQPEICIGELKQTDRGDSGFGSTGK